MPVLNRVKIAIVFGTHLIAVTGCSASFSVGHTKKLSQEEKQVTTEQSSNDSSNDSSNEVTVEPLPQKQTPNTANENPSATMETKTEAVLGAPGDPIALEIDSSDSLNAMFRWVSPATNAVTQELEVYSNDQSCSGTPLVKISIPVTATEWSIDRLLPIDNKYLTGELTFKISATNKAGQVVKNSCSGVDAALFNGIIDYSVITQGSLTSTVGDLVDLYGVPAYLEDITGDAVPENIFTRNGLVIVENTALSGSQGVKTYETTGKMVVEIVFKDVTGDAIKDLILTYLSASGTNGTIGIIPGGNLPPSGRVYTVGHEYVGPLDGDSLGMYIDFADINGDGVQDLISAAPYDNSSGSIYLIKGGATLPVSGKISESAGTMRINGPTGGFGIELSVAKDLNGDGCADLAIKDQLQPKVTIIAGSPTFAWVSGISNVLGNEYVDTVNTTDWMTVANSGDVTGDTIPELYFSTVGFSTVAWVFESATGAFPPSGPMSSISRWRIYTDSSTGTMPNYKLKDMRGGGLANIILADRNCSSNRGQIVIIGPTLPPSAAICSISSAIVLTGSGTTDKLGDRVWFADVTGDGRDDLIAGVEGPQDFIIFKSEPALASGTIGVVNSGARVNLSIALTSALFKTPQFTDLNGDGIQDIIAGSWSHTVIIAGSTNPTNITIPGTAGMVYDANPESSGLRLYDFDNDGDLDLFWGWSGGVGSSPGGIEAFVNTGSFPATKSGPIAGVASQTIGEPFDRLGPSAYSSSFVDLDGDNLGDFIARTEGKSVYVMKGSDLATPGTKAKVRFFTSETFVTSAYELDDLNNDGMIDLLFSTPNNIYGVFATAPGVFVSGDLDVVANIKYSTNFNQYGAISRKDIDGDGKKELIAGSESATVDGKTNAGFYFVIYPDGSGSFPPSSALADAGGGAFFGSAIDDKIKPMYDFPFDAIGNLFSISTNETPGSSATVLHMAGHPKPNNTGYFKVIRAEPGYLLSHMQPTDINADGFTDVIVSEYKVDDAKKSKFWIYYGKAGIAFHEPQRLVPENSGFNGKINTVGDFNNDGKLDLGFSGDGKLSDIVLLNQFLPAKP